MKFDGPCDLYPETDEFLTDRNVQDWLTAVFSYLGSVMEVGDEEMFENTGIDSLAVSNKKRFAETTAEVAWMTAQQTECRFSSVLRQRSEDVLEAESGIRTLNMTRARVTAMTQAVEEAIGGITFKRIYREYERKCQECGCQCRIQEYCSVPPEHINGEDGAVWVKDEYILDGEDAECVETECCEQLFNTTMKESGLMLRGKRVPGAPLGYDQIPLPVIDMLIQYAVPTGDVYVNDCPSPEANGDYDGFPAAQVLDLLKSMAYDLSYISGNNSDSE